MYMTKKNLSLNPIRKYRVHSGLSQVAFAKKTAVSVQAVSMTEFGVYETIPDGIENYLERRELNLEDVRNKYITFRIHIAYENSLAIRDLVYNLPDHNNTLNPIKQFRTLSLAITANAMSVHFLINPGIYRRLEETVVYANIPANIVSAFRDGGISSEIIEELQERYKEYWEYQRYGK